MKVYNYKLLLVPCYLDSAWLVQLAQLLFVRQSLEKSLQVLFFFSLTLAMKIVIIRWSVDLYYSMCFDKSYATRRSECFPLRQWCVLLVIGVVVALAFKLVRG